MQILNLIFLRSFLIVQFFVIRFYGFTEFGLVQSVLYFLDHIAIAVIFCHCESMQARKSLLSLQRMKSHTQFLHSQAVFRLQKETLFPPTPKNPPSDLVYITRFIFMGAGKPLDSSLSFKICMMEGSSLLNHGHIVNTFLNDLSP